MVDPNRKINRLTEKDIEFLEECEQEFSLRYTEDDGEFMEYCLRPLSDPPIIENWNNGGGDFFRNDDGGRYHKRPGNRNRRNWRGYKRGGRDQYDDHNGSYKQNKPYAVQQFHQVKSSNTMNIRRDYSNFVAASKDD